jgi:phthiocerol/phenolphthiocerol synthesis type-I polyketide synthase E
MEDNGARGPRRRRIADLSIEKRQLLERLLAREDLQAASVGATAKREPALTLPPVRRAELSGHRQKLRAFYDDVSASLDAGPLQQHALFLNYGYAEVGPMRAAVAPVPARSLNRNGVRLVLEVIGDCDLTGRDILDVGCGRGGTMDVINQRANPRRVVGVDLSTRAIRFCRSRRLRKVSVLEADAEQLPFRQGEFDVVTNIESSHCYADLGAFYREVRRVLRTGGMFLYADLLPATEMSDWLERLCSSGFIREDVRDITAHVLRSCRETAAQHAGAFAEIPGSHDVPEFVGLPGSDVYREMDTGATTYQIWRLRKAAEA